MVVRDEVLKRDGDWFVEPAGFRQAKQGELLDLGETSPVAPWPEDKVIGT